MKLLVLLLLAGCTPLRPDDPHRPKFEPCEVVVRDDRGNESCQSWRRVCRDLMNCEGQ